MLKLNLYFNGRGIKSDSAAKALGRLWLQFTETGNFRKRILFYFCCVRKNQ